MNHVETLSSSLRLGSEAKELFDEERAERGRENPRLPTSQAASDRRETLKVLK